MKKSDTIGDVTFGEEQPLRLITPIMPTSMAENENWTTAFQSAKPDLLEWRIDQLTDQSLPNIMKVAKQLHTVANEIPLIATIRTTAEGGPFANSGSVYKEIYTTLMEANLVQAIDIEASQPETIINELMATAIKTKTATIMSHHDFKLTPTPERIAAQLAAMAAYQPTIVKAAYMPVTEVDVVKLLKTTLESNAEFSPLLLTMTMGSLGKISRVMAKQFGSVATFVSLNGQSSAPGQLDIDQFRQIQQALDL